MKQFVFLVKYSGYADVRVEAETEEEAERLLCEKSDTLEDYGMIKRGFNLNVGILHKVSEREV